MTVKTIYLANADHNGEPICYQLRKGFQLLAKDGQPIPDRETGKDVWVGEILVPGLVAFGLNDRPETINIKVVGGPDPSIGDLTTVRFEGVVKLTAWYSPRARGNAAKSDLTINAERVVAAPDRTPRVRGGMPAACPDVSATFLGQHNYLDADAPGECDVVFAPVDIFAVDGNASIVCTNKVPDDLLMADVRPVGLRAFFRIPDSQDVSQRSKSELILACTSFERRVAANNGRTNRKPEPAAVAPDTSAES